MAFVAKYIFNTVLAHTLPASVYGNFSIALTLLAVFSTLLPLGTGSAAIRFLAKYMNASDSEQASAYLRWSLAILFFSSIVFLIILTIIIALLALFHVFDSRALVTYHIVFYILYLSPLSALAILSAYFLRSNQNVISFSIQNNLNMYLIYLFAIILTTYFFRLVYNYNVLWVLSLITLLILNLIGLSLLVLAFPRKVVTSTLRKSKQTTILWKKTSLHLILNQATYLIAGAIDLLAVKFFVPDSSRVGQYASLMILVSFVWLVTQSLYTPLGAKISTHISADKIEKPRILQRSINQLNLINLILVIILGAIAFIFSRQLISSFGITYYNFNSHLAFIILIAGQLFGSFRTPAGQLLTYSGNEMWAVYISIFKLVFITTLAIILTILFGIVGAAIASTSTSALITIASILASRHKVKIKSISIF